jgi:hypothetical protein
VLAQADAGTAMAAAAIVAANRVRGFIGIATPQVGMAVHDRQPRRGS